MVTEARNMSLENLSRGFRRAPVQGLTVSARSEACRQAAARTLAPRGTAAAVADLSGAGTRTSLPVAESALPGPRSQERRRYLHGEREIYCLGYAFLSAGIRLADERVII